MVQMSVVICSFNPRNDVIANCIECIAAADRIYSVEDVILVDNNSSKPLNASEWFLEAKKYFGDRLKYELEREQGLTYARLRGLALAKGNVIVFIDDDNFISPDFFRAGAEIALDYPMIGAWSGQVSLIFEKEPEAWTRRYWGLLVWREFEKDIWSNLPMLPETMPCGAGLFVRDSVADAYRKLHEEGKRNVILDRSGNSLFSGGDNDLAACACDIGFGVGLFARLHLKHFIPAVRLEREYLLKLAKGIVASTTVLRAYRGVFPEAQTAKTKIANIARLLMKRNPDRAFFKATLEGENVGRQIVENNFRNL